MCSYSTETLSCLLTKSMAPTARSTSFCRAVPASDVANCADCMRRLWPITNLLASSYRAPRAFSMPICTAWERRRRSVTNLSTSSCRAPRAFSMPICTAWERSWGERDIYTGELPKTGPGGNRKMMSRCESGQEHGLELQNFAGNNGNVGIMEHLTT